MKEAGAAWRSPAQAEPLLAISNLGMFGVKQFAAIIPPTCTSVLAIGSVREQPVLKNGKLENELVCSSLTISRRIIVLWMGSRRRVFWKKFSFI